MALSDFQALVADLLRDVEERIEDAERDRALASAVRRYAGDRPRKLVADVTAEAGHVLDLPEAWEPEVSAVQSIEYPVGEAPPAHLDAEAWRLYEGPDGVSIQIDDAAAAGAVYRIRFTAGHTLSAETDTIPARDREAVASYAAGLLLEGLAGIHAADSDEALVGAPVVQQSSKFDRYARRARTLIKRYGELLGVQEPRTQAAGTAVNWNRNDSRGRDRLTHPRYLR